MYIYPAEVYPVLILCCKVYYLIVQRLIAIIE